MLVIAQGKPFENIADLLPRLCSTLVSDAFLNTSLRIRKHKAHSNASGNCRKTNPCEIAVNASSISCAVDELTQYPGRNKSRQCRCHGGEYRKDETSVQTTLEAPYPSDNLIICAHHRASTSCAFEANALETPPSPTAHVEAPV